MSELGLELSNVIFYLISFVIAIFILQRFVFSPVAKIMNGREKEIKDAFELKEQLVKEHQHLDTLKQDILKNAQKEADGILAKARGEIAPNIDQMIKNGELKAREIVEKANKEAYSIIETAKAESGGFAKDALVAVLSKSLDNLKINPENAKMLLKEIITAI